MSDTDERQFRERLQGLGRRYERHLPGAAREVRDLWKQVQCQADADGVRRLYDQVHRLAGSAGLYGFPELSASARACAEGLADLPDRDPERAGHLQALRGRFERLVADLECATATGPGKPARS